MAAVGPPTWSLGSWSDTAWSATAWTTDSMGPTVTLSGTVTSAMGPSHVVAGGRTIVLTLVGDTWIPA